VDGGFWYSIPPHLRKDVAIGSILRVPLGGRRVRGYVIGLDAEREGKLKEILGVSGDEPVFDADLLQALGWAANHYVAPMAVLLDKAAPPTLPGKLTAVQASPAEGRANEGSPIEKFVTAAVAGRRRPVTSYIVHWADADWPSMLAPVAASTRSGLILVPTVREAGEIYTALNGAFPGRAVLIPDGNGSEVTAAWERANSGPAIVVGTPRAAYWTVHELAVAFVLEEGRRAMKDRQTPTVHVRDLMRTRSRVEGFGLAFVGPTPSVELIAAGAEIIQPQRPWGLVEVVDRRDDPPGSGFLSERALDALRSVAARGESAFVFTHMRAGDASTRCVACRALRLCARCGSNIGRNPECRRCGAPAADCRQCGGSGFESMGTIPSRLVKQIAARVGAEKVGESGEDALITVGTERDLAGLSGLTMAVAVDPDALIHGQNYRASEEALRILARLVGSVGRSRGYRTMLQTSDPGSGLISALRRGEPIPYLEEVLARRARDGFPPASEMMAIEARGVEPATVTAALQGLAVGMVMGPVETNDRHRWLLQGDLQQVRQGLRKTLQKLRDGGATIRVDADPIDL
jgi:primosomal protein N' (replication factor Y) (superfamily II helicase)